MPFLDEIDSGLDIDVLKVVTGANAMRRRKKRITHYQRLLNYHTRTQAMLVEARGSSVVQNWPPVWNVKTRKISWKNFT